MSRIRWGFLERRENASCDSIMKVCVPVMCSIRIGKRILPIFTSVEETNFFSRYFISCHFLTEHKFRFILHVKCICSSAFYRTLPRIPLFFKLSCIFPLPGIFKATICYLNTKRSHLQNEEGQMFSHSRICN
jgi:hypothetical protein